MESMVRASKEDGFFWSKLERTTHLTAMARTRETIRRIHYFRDQLSPVFVLVILLFKYSWYNKIENWGRVNRTLLRNPRIDFRQQEGNAVQCTLYKHHDNRWNSYVASVPSPFSRSLRLRRILGSFHSMRPNALTTWKTVKSTTMYMYELISVFVTQKFCSFWKPCSPLLLHPKTKNVTM